MHQKLSVKIFKEIPFQINASFELSINQRILKGKYDIVLKNKMFSTFQAPEILKSLEALQTREVQSILIDHESLNVVIRFDEISLSWYCHFARSFILDIIC